MSGSNSFVAIPGQGTVAGRGASKPHLRRRPRERSPERDEVNRSRGRLRGLFFLVLATAAVEIGIVTWAVLA